METIYTDAAIEREAVNTFLSSLFPALTFFYEEFDSLGMPVGFDPDNFSHLIYQTRFDRTKEEFGGSIVIWRTPDKDQEGRAHFIAKHLSEKFGIRTLVTFSLPSNPRDPYYDLIFENGKVFLADDLETSFGDDLPGRIKYLEEYSLVIPDFDGAAKIILNEPRNFNGGI